MRKLRNAATNRFRHWVHELWTTRGGGFYGFVAALMFVYLEAIGVAGDIAALGGANASLGWVIGLGVDFFIDTVVNTIHAAIWPVSWMRQFGVTLGSAALLGGCYVAYLAVRPTVLRWLKAGDEPELIAATANVAEPSRLRDL